MDAPAVNGVSRVTFQNKRSLTQITSTIQQSLPYQTSKIDRE